MSVTPLPSPATRRWNPLRTIALILRLFAASLLSAFIVGALGTACQYVRVVPLILRAEAFEERRLSEVGGDVPLDEPTEEWAPTEGLERGLYTLLSNVLVSFSFASLLVGKFALNHAHASMSSGMQRGVVGWAIFMGLPCAGLSPELPGMAAASVSDRQWWWIYSVAFAAAGLLVVVAGSRLVPQPTPAGSARTGASARKRTAMEPCYWLARTAILLVGILVCAVPHMTGAPHPMVMDEVVNTSTTCGAGHVKCERAGPPSEMAATFAVWCLGTAFVYWIALGAVTANAYNITMGFQLTIPLEIAVMPPLTELTVPPRSDVEDAKQLSSTSDHNFA